MPQPLRGQITFENVDFAYLAEKPVLSDIDVQINAGQSIGLSARVALANPRS